MKKYKSLLLVITLISIFALSKTNAIINDYSLLGKTIYLDAGHGGLWKIQILRNDYKY